MCGDYLNTFCLSRFPIDGNNGDLSVETLQATISGLSVCLEAPRFKRYWNEYDLKVGDDVSYINTIIDFLDIIQRPVFI
jgi:hypothetical protein